jgi:hypothetical protein
MKSTLSSLLSTIAFLILAAVNADAQVSSRPFTVVDRSSISQVTVGAPDAEVKTGYARIHASTGSQAPSGVAIFGRREAGVLVGETSVHAVSPLRAGRIFAEVGNGVNTGIAVANPNAADANISYYFTAGDGTTYGAGTLILPGNSQLSRFLDQAPFNGGSTIQGTFSFNSTVPVAIIALQSLINERGEFLMTALPVADTSNPLTGTVMFPYFADGGGWNTRLVLVNPSDSTIVGTASFFGGGQAGIAGQPVAVNVGERISSEFAVSIPPRGSQVFQTDGTGIDVQIGSIRVAPSPGSNTPVGLGIFSFKSGGITITQTGVPSIPASPAFRLYAEASQQSGTSKWMETGIAIANQSSQPILVTFEPANPDGSATGLVGTETIPASGVMAKFIGQNLVSRDCNDRIRES